MYPICTINSLQLFTEISNLLTSSCQHRATKQFWLILASLRNIIPNLLQLLSDMLHLALERLSNLAWGPTLAQISIASAQPFILCFLALSLCTLSIEQPPCGPRALILCHPYSRIYSA